MKPISFLALSLFVLILVPQSAFADDVHGIIAVDRSATTTDATSAIDTPTIVRPDTTAPAITTAEPAPNEAGTSTQPPRDTRTDVQGTMTPSADGLIDTPANATTDTPTTTTTRERTLPVETGGVAVRPAPVEVKTPVKKVDTNAQAGFNKDVQNQVGSIVKGISNAFHAIGNVLNSIKSFFLSVNAYLSK